MSKTAATLSFQALNHTLKRAELTKIAASIGSPVSGTKSDLFAGIEGVLSTSKDLLCPGRAALEEYRELRVLSVDLGIKNLAYAFVTAQIETAKGRPARLRVGQPRLQRWRRIAVMKDSLLDQAERLPSAADESTVAEIVSTIPDRESFEPPILARHAFDVVQHFGSLRPTHILIERQRFRSGGMAAVQEWTLRVGVFEGMLWAILHTLRERQELQAQVEAILPARVNRFWLEQSENLPGKLRKTISDNFKASGKNAKRTKIELVRGLLDMQRDASSAFVMDETVKPTASFFSNKASSKLDDLSDSLLQGLAWLTWQNGRLELLQTKDNIT